MSPLVHGWSASFCNPGIWWLGNLHALCYRRHLCSPPQPYHLLLRLTSYPSTQVETSQGQNMDEILSQSYTGLKTGPWADAPSQVWWSVSTAADYSQYSRETGGHWFWFLYSFLIFLDLLNSFLFSHFACSITLLSSSTLLGIISNVWNAIFLLGASLLNPLFPYFCLNCCKAAILGLLPISPTYNLSFLRVHVVCIFTYSSNFA